MQFYDVLIFINPYSSSRSAIVICAFVEQSLKIIDKKRCKKNEQQIAIVARV